MAEPVRRVLIYRLGSLGDMVVALPSLHLVARAFPDAERRMLTNFPVNVKAPAAAAVVGESGLVQGYLRYAVGMRSPKEILRLWWEIVRWGPEVLVYLAAARGVKAARRDAMFFRLCGVRRMIGVPVTEAMQENCVLAGDLEPEAERLARNLAELGDARVGDEASWDLRLTDTEKDAARAALAPVLGRPMIAVSVGTKVQAKDWGVANWRELLTRLGAAYPDHALMLAGAAEESEASEFAASAWRGPAVNLCGKLSPRESAAALAHARVFVGHDSGPMHLAAAVQTPCVAIFAARNRPRVWFPYGTQHRVVYHRVDCWGCGLETCIEQRKKCLTSITVDEVLQQILGALEGVTAGR